MKMKLFDSYQNEEAKDNQIMKVDKINKLKSSLVKIEIGNKIGTGFFYLIGDEDFKIPVLVTSNHIIDLDLLSKDKKLKIHLNNSKVKKEIKIKGNTKRFTNKCLDITMIEIEKFDLIKFLEYDDEEIKEEKNICIFNIKKVMKYLFLME